MSGTRKAAAELLDVPALNPLERRLNLQSSSNGPRPSIVPVPKSALLSRLQQFMPQMEAANQKLSSEMQVRPASDFDVENVPDEQEDGYIEMDLSCGVLDLKDADALRAAEAAMAGHGPDLNADSSSDDTSSSSDDDKDDRAGDADMAEAGGAGVKDSNQAQASTQTKAKASVLGQGGQTATPAQIGNRRRRKAVRVGGVGAGEGARKQNPKIVEL